MTDSDFTILLILVGAAFLLGWGFGFMDGVDYMRKGVDSAAAPQNRG